MSRDPIGYHASDVNLKRYVANNPTNVRDSSGKAAAPLVVAAGVGLLGVGVILLICRCKIASWKQDMGYRDPRTGESNCFRLARKYLPVGLRCTFGVCDALNPGYDGMTGIMPPCVSPSCIADHAVRCGAGQCRLFLRLMAFMAHECFHATRSFPAAANEYMADTHALHAMKRLRDNGGALCESLAAEPGSPCASKDDCISTSLQVEQDIEVGD